MMIKLADWIRVKMIKWGMNDSPLSKLGSRVINGQNLKTILFPNFNKKTAHFWENISNGDSNLFKSYLVAVGGAVLIVIFNWGLKGSANWGEAPFVLSFIPIVLAAIYGGAKIGFIATVLLMIVADSEVIYHFGQGPEAVNLARMVIFLIEGGLASYFIGKLKSSENNAIQKAELLTYSEYHLQNVINNLYGLVGVMALDGTLIEINKESLHWSQLKAEDVVGKQLKDTYWWNFSSKSQHLLVEAINTAKHGRIARYDTTIRVADKKFLTLDLAIFPIKNKLGQIQYLIPFGTDVTQRIDALKDNQQLLRELKHEKNKIESIIDNMPGVVWESKGLLYSPKSNIVYLSPYAEVMTGYPLKELTNPRDWFNLIHPDDRKRLVDDTKKMISDKNDFAIYRFRLVARNGGVIWVENRIRIIRDENGKVVGGRGVIIDVTDRVNQERQKDEFIRIASHELKTPLATVKAFSQIVKKKVIEGQNDEAVHYLQRMDYYMTRLTKIIQDFLDFSKIQSGKLDLYPEDFEMKDLLMEAATDFQPTVESHQILIDRADSCPVRGDRTRISQVVINLLSNAVKYSPEAKEVHLNLKKIKNEAKIEVIDKGIGVDEASQKKIFERFYRVNQPKKIKIEGFGLGLYISSEIISRHEGRIGVKSQVGKGSTFYFYLPLRS